MTDQRSNDKKNHNTLPHATSLKLLSGVGRDEIIVNVSRNEPDFEVCNCLPMKSASIKLHTIDNKSIAVLGKTKTKKLITPRIGSAHAGDLLRVVGGRRASLDRNNTNYQPIDGIAQHRTRRRRPSSSSSSSSSSSLCCLLPCWSLTQSTTTSKCHNNQTDVSPLTAAR